MIILIILLYLVVGAIEMIPLFLEKKKREFLLYMGMFILSWMISILLAIGVKIPTPAKPIKEWISFVAKNI